MTPVFHTLQVLLVSLALLVVVFLVIKYGMIEWREGRAKPQKLVLSLSPILEAKNIANGLHVTAIFYTGYNAKDVEAFVLSTDYNYPDIFLDAMLMQEPVASPNQYIVRTPQGAFVNMNEQEFDEEFALLNWRVSEREGAMNYMSRAGIANNQPKKDI